MSFDCPECGGHPSKSDIDERLRLVTCPFCGTVFGAPDGTIPSQAPPSTGDGASAAPEKRPMDRPEGLSVEQDANGFTFSRRWFGPVVIFLTIFCIVWNGFLVFWYTMAFSQQGPLIMKLFPIGHLAVGIGLTYFVIASYVNTTSVRIGYDAIQVAHGPVPWRGNKTIDTAEVEQLSVKEKVYNTQNGSHVRYTLRAHTVDQRTITLAKFEDSDHAAYIEQEAERFLGIEDRPVADA